MAKLTDRHENNKNKIVLVRSNSKNNVKDAEKIKLKAKNIKEKPEKSG